MNHDFSKLPDLIDKHPRKPESLIMVLQEIQREYKLPLRPNETLKDTMIRVRLNFLKQNNKLSRTNSANNPGSLPIDPLE